VFQKYCGTAANSRMGTTALSVLTKRMMLWTRPGILNYRRLSTGHFTLSTFKNHLTPDMWSIPGALSHLPVSEGATGFKLGTVVSNSSGSSSSSSSSSSHSTFVIGYGMLPRREACCQHSASFYNGAMFLYTAAAATGMYLGCSA
jgi:hypothetical protein